MSEKLAKYCAEFEVLHSDAQSLIFRLHKAREDLNEQVVNSRAAIEQSRELMKRADKLTGAKR